MHARLGRPGSRDPLTRRPGDLEERRGLRSRTALANRRVAVQRARFERAECMPKLPPPKVPLQVRHVRLSVLMRTANVRTLAISQATRSARSELPSVEGRQAAPGPAGSRRGCPGRVRRWGGRARGLPHRWPGRVLVAAAAAGCPRARCIDHAARSAGAGRACDDYQRDGWFAGCRCFPMPCRHNLSQQGPRPESTRCAR